MAYVSFFVKLERNSEPLGKKMVNSNPVDLELIERMT
jgi:hypothetical protein